MSAKAVLRFVKYKITRDPDRERTWRARCVSGDEEECGAESMVFGGDEDPIDWMAEHAKETGHTRFERTYKDYALVEKVE
ncbi:hypothetical protein AAW14_24360 [Streptomyces hygroscopicus]|uniref:DUF7848 domain-containing protein n=1 Tax=Streptomyces hygroscopicus TaxID=1912 RepID=UPI00223FFA84|nr:hypothetical protein [Streptomyces hygroscopicus]MCW7945048.1 hypothetical protein [Streptomyces hygroscopicus]